jgi:hypothetical protein
MTQHPTTVKARLFALYLGQKVLNDNGSDPTNPIIREPVELTYLTDNGLLELRSISDLTDEEAVILGFMGSGNVKRCLEVYSEDDFYRSFINKVWIVDYLRSIGIALPFTYLEDGKPVTISVEEQVQRGYIKLKAK